MAGVKKIVRFYITKKERKFMNKSVQIAVSTLVVFSATMALAAGARSRPETRPGVETRTMTPQEREQRFQAEQRQRSTEQQISLKSDLADALVRLTNVVTSRELRDAMDSVGSNLIGSAKAILEMDSAVKTKRITDEAKRIQLERAIPICTEFIASGKLLSLSGAVPSKEILAFKQQISIIETLSSMTPGEIKSHLDMMEKSNSNARTGLSGDAAYAKALKEKYKQGYAEKLDEIINCLKG